MFKPVKKVNENAVKKDFFGVKKNKTNVLATSIENFNFEGFYNTNDFITVKPPNKNGKKFIISSKNRSLFDFLPCETDEVLFFCSRLDLQNFKKAKTHNIIGVGISNRILEKNNELFREVQAACKTRFYNNHCKMLLFKKGNDYICVEGSGNPSVNARNEFYIMSNSKNQYDAIVKCFENA